MVNIRQGLGETMLEHRQQGNIWVESGSAQNSSAERVALSLRMLCKLLYTCRHDCAYVCICVKADCAYV